jgi:hypothetical protein
MQLTAKIKAMSAADLQKIANDPRLSDRQKRKLNRLIKAKEAEAPKPTTAAAKNARPVDPKVAKKVDKALAKKTEGPQYTPEQLAAQDAWLKKNAPEPPKMAGRTVKQEMDRAVLRGEVKLDRPKVQGKAEYQSVDAETLGNMKQSYRTMQQLMKDPGWQTPSNRARLINMRLAIWEKERALREKTKRQASPEVAKAVSESPKYDKTPGSTKPIPKPKEVDVAALMKQRNKLSKELDDEKDPEKALKISQELLDVGSRIYRAEAGAGAPDSPGLRQIYEQQGFNSKPELVATASDLRKRKDLMKGSDGNPVILYRGVSTTEFADQFKGRGPEGETHYPGRGIFGNGSYAAAASDASPQTSAAAPIKTAKAYAGDQTNLSTKITAFALRKDANVATFPGKEQSQREIAYDQWYDETIDRAQKETGYRYRDVGEAAAALGYHAYQVPQRSGEDFYVVLNRGAVVAAMDSEIEP